MILRSPAKINLFLNIIKKRNDSYHNIETYFQFVNLYDEITLDATTGSKINFSSNSDLICDDDNLCVKAAKILKNYVAGGFDYNVSIKLLKNIPIGGGLGGGSSNAASVLLGLNDLWKCDLKKEELLSLGEKLGSDVPVFINGFSAYGENTGNQLTNYSFDKKYFLIVDPGIHVSSKIMYEKYEIKDCIKRINLDNMHQNIGFNSFENLLCKENSEIKDLLQILRRFGNGSVSGSGGCLFSMFDDEDGAKNISKHISDKYRTYIVHSLNRI